MSLAPTETVQHNLCPAWTNYTRQLLLAWLVYPFLKAWYDRSTTRYIVTDQRLIMKERELGAR